MVALSAMLIKVIAPFEVPGIDGNGMLEIEPGTNIRKLARKFKINFISALILPVSVNGEVVSKSYQLHDGDTVIFLFPMSGG